MPSILTRKMFRCPSSRVGTFLVLLSASIGFCGLIRGGDLPLFPNVLLRLSWESSDGRNLAGWGLPVKDGRLLVGALPHWDDLAAPGPGLMNIHGIGEDRRASRLLVPAGSGFFLARVEEGEVALASQAFLDFRSLKPGTSVQLRPEADEMDVLKASRAPVVPARFAALEIHSQEEAFLFPMLRIQLAPEAPRAKPGTPVTDDQGRLIGIVSAHLPKEPGALHVIPMEAVEKVCSDWKNGETTGRSWVGLQFLEATQVPQVARVARHSPAEAAGIRRGDIILSCGAHLIGDLQDLMVEVALLPLGQPVEWQLLRQQDTLSVSLTPVQK